ncbi:hypothetical protein [Acetobacter oeni]|uniref:Uncharacterized protein n=1 Tax=Acetobacter oeni TaxID=304077 RepID=A0A511XP75_9PROT|nr:hypothetical protein [Acetobacter oeni]MBB3884483.1 hypothetical protein [Acetobacter oeni]NHO20415.1 hypothetical protein [Acetobacter oeni]GBR00521.1 hypothetical protein AA21952_0129 [Acetobacter oeni LMG 21952]GEN64706.1 hypothetical protein AOE01nite_29300 [Acetobacter oeni]
MADFVGLRDIASYITPVSASAVTAITAGAAAAAVTGATIDRVALGLPQTLVFLFQSSAKLTASATLSLNSLQFQTSPDGATWTDYVDPYRAGIASPGAVSTGPVGGGTVAGVTPVEVYVASSDQYFRAVFTPALSATTSDTATIMVAAIAAGFAHNPAP